MRVMKPILCLCFSLIFTAQLSAQDAPTLADDGLQPVIEHLAQNPTENAFELGMLQTLRAVEKSLQIRYLYGLGDRLGRVPLLRLQARGLNPNPQTPSHDTLTTLVRTFLAEIDTARASLASAEPRAFTLTVQDLWFDVNDNGLRDRGEDVTQTLGPIVLGRAYSRFSRSEAAKEPLTIRFDTADHAWLTAYTHMLSGFGNLYMAFDPSPVLKDLEDKRAALANAPTIPNFYDQDALAAEISRLEDEKRRVDETASALQDQQKPMRQTQSELRNRLRDTEDATERETLQDQINQIRQAMQPISTRVTELRQQSRLISNEIDAAKAKLLQDPSPLQRTARQMRGGIDALYITLAALQQQPDPDRIKTAYSHWRAMIEENRKFWKLLAEETDNDREWIPNPQQVSALPVEVPAEVAEAWQNILVDADAVLEGRLLVPHPLLPAGHGINIPAYVEAPSPLGLMEWAHGIGAYPYVAKGPLITGQSWQAFRRLTGGNAGGFALFFN